MRWNQLATCLLPPYHLDHFSLLQPYKQHQQDTTIKNPPERSNQIKRKRKKTTYPYAITTAPSSNACRNVLYPLCFPSPYPLPGLSTANHSSKFRLMNGNRLSIGSRISETNDVTTAVNALANLRRSRQCLSSIPSIVQTEYAHRGKGNRDKNS